MDTGKDERLKLMFYWKKKLSVGIYFGSKFLFYAWNENNSGVFF